MAATKYLPAKGALYGKKEAAALGAVLESIGFSATPAQIVEAARPVKSPIHKLFEWNNTVAGEKYRLQQARWHTAHLEVVIVSGEGTEKTKAFHSVVISNDAGDREKAYCSMENISENSDLREQVIAKALAELNAWKFRYGQYRRVFSEVFKAIDATGKKRRRRKQVA